MVRLVACFLVASLVAGCRLPPENEALRPLPDAGKSFTYAELLTRARTIASVAVEAFYVDNWNEVEEAATSLEQTARYLPKSTDPPVHLKDQLAAESDTLRQDSQKLGDAARAKNAREVTDALGRIHYKIRTLKGESR